jgi:GDP-L-fucose synthase
MAKILVTGGNGFLGRFVIKELLKTYKKEEIYVPRSAIFDLTDRLQVDHLYNHTSPEIVIHLAAVVGGIGANMENPGKFFYDNMAMGLHLIEGARKHNIKKFVQIGTVCAYPKICSVPFLEEDIWAGYPEETNAPYGIAKKSLFVMLEAYKKQYELNSTVLVPCNLYGPYDNFDPKSSHVIPALIRKFVEAKINKSPFVECWGSGNATREFLYASDAARAIAASIEIDTDPSPINLGGGVEISIRDLVNKIKDLCEYSGEIVWNSSKPDGQPRRFLDITKAKRVLGWTPTKDFTEGLRETINWYLSTL